MSSSLGSYPNQGCYNWARWLIWASMFWGLISALIEVYGLWLVGHADDADQLTLDNYDSALQTTATIQTALIVVSELVFLNWWGKSRQNLQRFGAISTGTGTNLAQASWIIPIVALWVPYQHTLEMSSQDGKAPPTLLPWWIAWLLYSLMGRVANRIFKNADSLSGVMHGLQVYLFSDLCFIAAGVWLLPVMGAIHQRESRLAAQQNAARQADFIPQPL